MMKKTIPIDAKSLKKTQQRVAKTILSDDHWHHDLTQNMMSRLDIIRIQPAHVLCFGWHTEHVMQALQNRYPNAVIQQAHDFQDVTQYEKNSVQLIIALFPLQITLTSDNVLKALHHILSEEGLLLFVDLGPDTLIELRESFSAVDDHPHVRTFTDMHDVGDWIRALHFSDPVMDRETITLAYDELYLLFQDLKEVGAINIDVERSRGLMGTTKWKAMLSHYAQCKTEDYFPVTLELIYGHGWKVPVTEDPFESGEVVISVDDILRRK